MTSLGSWQSVFIEHTVDANCPLGLDTIGADVTLCDGEVIVSCSPRIRTTLVRLGSITMSAANFPQVARILFHELTLALTVDMLPQGIELPPP